MKIKISELENIPNKVQVLNFSEIYEEFNKTVPVNAVLEVKINGNIIKISGNIQASLNLTCDICLKEFTKEIKIPVEEYYIKDTLNEGTAGEFELTDGNFLEDLNGCDEIDITNFVYQCVILHIPNKLVCDINCKGEENLSKYIKNEFSDPRLEVFKNIKIEKE